MFRTHAGDLAFPVSPLSCCSCSGSEPEPARGRHEGGGPRSAGRGHVRGHVRRAHKSARPSERTGGILSVLSVLPVLPVTHGPTDPETSPRAAHTSTDVFLFTSSGFMRFFPPQFLSASAAAAAELVWKLAEDDVY